jgi:hypothetical protein
MVSQEETARLAFQSRLSSGRTTVPENQSDMARSDAMETSIKFLRGEGALIGQGILVPFQSVS